MQRRDFIAALVALPFAGKLLDAQEEELVTGERIRLKKITGGSAYTEEALRADYVKALWHEQDELLRTSHLFRTS